MDKKTSSHQFNQGGFFLLALLFAGRLAAQNASLSLEPARIEPGDTFALRVIVTGVAAQPESVDFGPWREILPPENILSRAGWQRSGAAWTYKCTLIAFDSAALQLPPLNVRLHLGKSLETNAVQLKVIPRPLRADVAAMAPARDIRREPALWIDYWPWAAGALALLLLLVWQIRRRRRKKPAAAAPPSRQTPLPEPELPVHQLALQKIDALARQRLWEKGDLKTHYVELSFILREYLEKRFQIPALESTTREILNLLKSATFPLNLNTTLRQLLEQADLAKYAQMPPPPEFHEKSLQNARELVLQTISKTAHESLSKS